MCIVARGLQGKLAVTIRGFPLRLIVAIAALIPTLLLTHDLGAQAVDHGIVVAATTEAISFHPYLTSDTASSSYQSLVYGGSLLERDPQNIQQVRGNFAERWSVSDDHLTYTFTLRPNLTWSDGEPLTSEDFRWTYDQVSRPDSDWTYAGNLDEIVAYETPDARTIVVRLADVQAIGLETADAITPLPKHVWENLDWSDPTRNPEIMAPSVGSGPFRLLEWAPGDHAIFVPNEHYYKGRPRLSHYTVLVTPPQQATGYQLLRSGRVDFTGLRPADYALARRLENASVYDWWPATGNWSYIGFNFRQPLLQDVRVRQALAYAVDRDTMIQQTMYGLAQPTYSAYGPTCWCYNPDVPHRDYDLDRARSLLDEAGFLPGPAGIREKAGQPLHLRLVFGPQSSEVRAQIARLARESWHQIGVDVEITALPWELYLHWLRTPPYAWDLQVGGWQATIDPHWMHQIWSADQIPNLNHGAYRNTQLDALFQQGAREFDQDARKRIYQQIQQLLVEDQAAIFLFQNKSFVGVSNRIGGLRPSPLGLEWNIQDWYVK
jgi:peptide/nickel transport system substrate-binding protein